MKRFAFIRIMLVLCTIILIFLWSFGRNLWTHYVNTTPTFKFYQNKAFSLNYPQDWTITETQHDVTFTSPDASKSFFPFTSTIPPSRFVVSFLPDPHHVLSPVRALNTEVRSMENLATKSVQEATISPEFTINGTTWEQKEFTSRSTKNGIDVNLKNMVLVTRQNNIIYTIIYITDVSYFDEEEKTTFQPMLQSFVFFV